DSSQSLGFGWSAPITAWVAPAKKPLDTIFGMPGFGVLGIFTDENNGDPLEFRFFAEDTDPAQPDPWARSTMPGDLISSTTAFGTTLPAPAWDDEADSSETSTVG